MGYKEENSYGSIIRRISAFGGVQVFNILIGLVRGKLVALFLGPEGMGISSLFASSTATIQQFSSLGLNAAAVKEVAAAKDNQSRLHSITRTTLRLFGITALIGALACILLSPLWSRMTFGDGSETFSYLWLGIAVALSIGGGGYLAMLQGLGEVKRLSKASLVGGCAGLFFGVPLYWLFGIAGIVPAMIILALCTFLFYYLSYRKSQKGVETSELPTDRRVSRLVARRLVSLGIVLLVASAVGTLTQYLINIFVREFGSLDDVGLYQAATSITNQYIGLVFAALAMDYFPRLSAICMERDKLNEVYNRQTEIVMLVATPLLTALILTAPLVIRLLLTSEFIAVCPLMRWLGVGMLVQALNFPLGYIFVARGDRRVYLWLECFWTNLLWIVCSVGGFWLYGLIGLGVSLVVRGAIDFVVTFTLGVRLYGLRLVRSSVLTVALSVLLCGGCFAASWIDGIAGYLAMGGFCLVSVLFSGLRLRSRLAA